MGQCAVHLAAEPQPRLARRLRVLADAFTEGIAADTLRHLDGGGFADDPCEVTRRSQQLAILLFRLARIPPVKRPRYTPDERAEILSLKFRHRLSNRQLARWFLLDRGTLSAWLADVDAPHARTTPLVETLPDLEAVLEAIQDELPPIPRRLRDEVQRTLRAIASSVPPRSRRSRARKAKAPAAEPVTLTRIQDALLLAERVNHIWSADLTTIEIGRQFYLAAILDLYSRRVVAWRLFACQPGAAQIRALFETAVRQCRTPDHFVTDKGKQFEAGVIEEMLETLDVSHRTGAVGRHGSIALIERMWRTAKETLHLDSVRPNVPAILGERVAVIVDYYNAKRPHMALGNATPNDVYTGRPSRAYSAKRAPRGWRGEPSPPVPFVVRHAFPHEQRLPYLERVA